MRPTQAPSSLCPAPPPRSGLQRWPSESRDRCHAMSAGPPTHRQDKLQCCTRGITHSSTCLFWCKMASVPTHSIHFIPPHISVIGIPKSHNLKDLPLLSECPDNITNMHRFMIKINKTCLCTCRERAVLGGTLATSPCSFLFLNLRKYSWMRKVA